MADVNRGNRPLSPHLQVYKLPLTAVTSIMTRITGHALVAGALLLTWWLVAAATSPHAFARADWVATSWLGLLVWAGSIWALWFHFLAGLRHLYYDAGKGLDIPTANLLAKGVLIGSFVLTALTLILFCI